MRQLYRLLIQADHRQRARTCLIITSHCPSSAWLVLLTHFLCQFHLVILLQKTL